MWQLQSQIYLDRNDLLDGFDNFIMILFPHAVRWKWTTVSIAIYSVLFLIINTIYLQCRTIAIISELFAGNQGNHQNFVPSLVPINFWLIYIGMKQKKKKNWRKKFKMADSKNWVFQPPPKAEQFSPKFHKSILGWVGSIDANGIHFAQPIWSSGCLM